LLSQHRDERGQHGYQETRVHEAGDSDDLGRRILLRRRNCRRFTRDSRLVESEEDCAEESSGLFVRVGSEARMDVDDESGADGRE